MQVRYNILEIDKPMFGRIIFPRTVVVKAIEAARAAGIARNRFGTGILELCRYEVYDPVVEHHDPAYDEMIGRLSQAGRLLEVIGLVFDLEIVDKTLWASGDIQGNLQWPLPQESYVPVPYMDMRAKRDGDHRVVTEFFFTEIVLVYQEVTMLANSKFAEMRSRSRARK